MVTLVGLFKTAIENLQKQDKNEIRVKIALGDFVYKLASNKQKIWVTDTAKWPTPNVLYGAIALDTGLFHPKAGVSKEIIDSVIEHMSHPTDAIKAYGRKTGFCCICGRHLVNKTSVKYMIGPICAERLGLDLESMAIEDERKEQASIWDEL